MYLIKAMNYCTCTVHILHYYIISLLPPFIDAIVWLHFYKPLTRIISIITRNPLHLKHANTNIWHFTS